jgi:hypothetical protein
MNCACGQPLHYTNLHTKALVERLCEEVGEYVVVVMDGKRYRVQRHFIALHGLKAQELEELVVRGIVMREENVN